MARVLHDPELFGEDLASLAESADWTVWTGEDPPQRAPGLFEPCERCGMLVCAAAIRRSRDWPDGKFSRHWWEPGLGRLHTPRRCRFLLDLYERRPVGPSRFSDSGILPWRDQVAIMHYGACHRCGTWRWKHRFLDGRWGIICQGCVSLQDSLVMRASPEHCTVISRS